MLRDKIKKKLKSIKIKKKSKSKEYKLEDITKFLEARCEY
jgi:hypothetical protein